MQRQDEQEYYWLTREQWLGNGEDEQYVRVYSDGKAYDTLSEARTALRDWIAQSSINHADIERCQHRTE